MAPTFTQTTRNGSWVDVTPLPDGRVAIAMLRGSAVTVEAVRLGAAVQPLWTVALVPGASLLYLRAAADGTGRVAAIGQGVDGQAWLTREGAALEPLGDTFGVFCVEVRGLAAGGWELAILRPGFYERLALPIAGPATVAATVPTPTTQGFLQIDGGIIVLQDEARTSVPGLVLPEWADGYAAGQNADAGPNRVRMIDEQQPMRYAALVEAYAQPPHVVVARDGSVWVCAWLDTGAWVAGYAPEAIPWGNEAPPPDPPDPPTPSPDPPKATIASYDPSRGPAPLTVRAVARVDAASGPIDAFVWQYRPRGESAWIIAATNPAHDLDHAFTFTDAGAFEIGLHTTGPGGTDQTGTPRIIEVTGSVTPPDPPEPEPEPERPAVATSFTCLDGVHYLCADLGVDDTQGTCRVVADRTSVGAYETFDVEFQGDAPDMVAIKAHTNGRYLRADEGGGRGLYADRDAVESYERFRLVPCAQYPNAYSLQVQNGQFVQARGGGGGEVVADGVEPDAAGNAHLDGLFTSAVPLRPTPETAGRVLQGRVRWIDGQGIADNLGLFVPVFYHHGDAGLWWAQNPDDVKRVLDVTQPRGAHGFRAWMGRLLPSYWDNYILDPSQFDAFQRELKARNLRLMWDGGDLGRASRDERDYVRQVLLDVGDRDVLASVSMCNEGNDNSEMEPGEMADWLAPIAERWPDLPIWCTTGGAGHEDTAHGRTTNPNYNEHRDMDRWNPGPSRLVGKHGYRDGSIVDKARHCFSFVYEGQPTKWVTVDDEPPGPGEFVSVIENRQQLTPEGVCTIFLTAAIAGQWWVFFPGLEKHTQSIEQFVPHLERLVAQAAQLPPDLFAFEDLEHGGSSQSRRVWEVTDSPGPETARCDHALANDGRYVCSCYDEGEAGRQNFRQRGGTETSRIENPPWGFVSLGTQ